MYNLINWCLLSATLLNCNQKYKCRYVFFHVSIFMSYGVSLMSWKFHQNINAFLMVLLLMLSTNSSFLVQLFCSVAPSQPRTKVYYYYLLLLSLPHHHHRDGRRHHRHVDQTNTFHSISSLISLPTAFMLPAYHLVCTLHMVKNELLLRNSKKVNLEHFVIQQVNPYVCDFDLKILFL